MPVMRRSLSRTSLRCHVGALDAEHEDILRLVGEPHEWQDCA